MNFFKKLLDKSGVAYLFKPSVNDEKEAQTITEWINDHLLSILDAVEKDIALEKQGLYSHSNQPADVNIKSDSLGYVEYVIKDKSGGRLELSQFSLVSCNGIKMTDNYKRLKSFSDKNGYTLELKEVNIDGDGVDTYEELDDYLDDFERYLIITISGW